MGEQEYPNVDQAFLTNMGLSPEGINYILSRPNGLAAINRVIKVAGPFLEDPYRPKFCGFMTLHLTHAGLATAESYPTNLDDILADPLSIASFANSLAWNHQEAPDQLTSFKPPEFRKKFMDNTGNKGWVYIPGISRPRKDSITDHQTPNHLVGYVVLDEPSHEGPGMVLSVDTLNPSRLIKRAIATENTLTIETMEDFMTRVVNRFLLPGAEIDRGIMHLPFYQFT